MLKRREDKQVDFATGAKEVKKKKTPLTTKNNSIKVSLYISRARSSKLNCISHVVPQQACKILGQKRILQYFLLTKSFLKG